MTDAAIPAATLVVVRETEHGAPLLLMVERSTAMAFAPGAFVFPGGRIEAADVALAERLGMADGAARIAAIRETLEECAIPVGLVPVPTRAVAVEWQRSLIAGDDFGTLIQRGGFKIEADALTPFARWIPDHEVSRRFDTLFFLAKASNGAELTNIIGDECVSAKWVSAADALAGYRAGNAKLIYPTFKNLERLAQFNNFADVLDDARRYPLVRVTAEVEAVGGEEHVCIPDGLGYPSTRDRLAEVWRG